MECLSLRNLRYKMKNIAVIGAGAAGCFCAIELKRRLPEAVIDIYEGGHKALAKVAVTGGGRCNISNTFGQVDKLSKVYPRGDKLMKRMLARFGPEDLMAWFEKEGVTLVEQDEGRIFPASQDSMQIVRLLTSLIKNLGINLHTRHKVIGIEKNKSGYSLDFLGGKKVEADVLIVTTGGLEKKEISTFSSLDLEIKPPVPSLFTFSMAGDPITDLMGAAVEKTVVSLISSPFKASGPILVTDWGLSGPAILKLSSYAAVYMKEQEYKAGLSINWAGDLGEIQVREIIEKTAAENPQKQIGSTRPSFLPSRLWSYLVTMSGARKETRWAETGSKGMNRLINQIVNDTHKINGKSRHRDEFVTCGGIALSNVSMKTLESKTYPGLYFAGEILDVDAVTGGFNLQAAWSTAYVVAESVSDAASAAAPLLEKNTRAPIPDASKSIPSKGL